MASLKEKYDECVHEYGKAFCNSLKFRYDPLDWVGGKIGGVYEIFDSYFDFKDMKYSVDNKVSEKVLMEWYYYCIEVKHLSETLHTPDLESWCNGCKVLSKEQLDKLHEAKNNLDNAIEIASVEINKSFSYGKF